MGSFCVKVTNVPRRWSTRYLGAVPRAPQSRSGRYEDLATDELTDIIERAYYLDELPDWELVFELSRRAQAVAGGSEDQSVGASRPR